MPRNPAFILTPADAQRATANRAMLSTRVGTPVTLDYVKRDGTPSTLIGTVSGFVGVRKGSESTEAVTLITDKGERSANLWAIKSIA